jgi:hypothetical protein
MRNLNARGHDCSKQVVIQWKHCKDTGNVTDLRPLKSDLRSQNISTPTGSNYLYLIEPSK